jgi:cell division protein FtsI/penicillin-binding protein 2
VVDTGINDAGEEVIRVGHPNTGGTLAMFTKNDIRNNDGYLRVGGRNFQVQPSLINWANS